MKTAIIILSVVLYLVMGMFVGVKYYHACYDKKGMSENDSETGGLFAGVFWPIALTYYVILCIFFRPWL